MRVFALRAVAVVLMGLCVWQVIDKRGAVVLALYLDVLVVVFVSAVFLFCIAAELLGKRD